MSPLELRVFAYLAWACAANREVSYRDIGRLSLTNGDFIGARTAVKAVEDLSDSGLIAVRGDTQLLHAALRVRIAGHQPRPSRSPQDQAADAPAVSQTFVPVARDRFSGTPDPGALTIISANQVRGQGWSTLPPEAKLRRRLWGVVHGKGPMICSRTAQYEASRGRPATSEELAHVLGWQDGTPVSQAFRLLVQTRWLAQTDEGLLHIGPAYKQHLAAAVMETGAAAQAARGFIGGAWPLCAGQSHGDHGAGRTVRGPSVAWSAGRAGDAGCVGGDAASLDSSAGG
ncbi:hypothetical protein ACFQ6Q_04625 [Streptomyces sp. NPDC056437]|uniref:hypothetical protein n=1 Tax=Streptomyces sp. NPDC056437 TaxID=3345816 RepID=UPI0036A688C1